MLDTLLEYLLIFSMPLAFFGVLWGLHRRQRAQFFRECDAFHDVRPIHRTFGQFGLETIHTTPSVAVVISGGSKNNPPHWRIDASLPEFGARTRLHIGREGRLGALREKLGITDIHIGDADFDRTFSVRGSDADVVRAVIGQPHIQDAIWTLFMDHAVQFLKLDKDGHVYVWIARTLTSAAEARERAFDVAALTTALYHVERALPGAGVGGSTGAPVGISLGRHR